MKLWVVAVWFSYKADPNEIVKVERVSVKGTEQEAVADVLPELLKSYDEYTVYNIKAVQK